MDKYPNRPHVYVPIKSGGDVEGVDVNSTGEVGGVKVLTEDGTGGSSWETLVIPTASNFLFADNTTVAPVTSGLPSIAEITTFAGTARDAHIYYNKTDTADVNTAIGLWYIDAAGSVIEVRAIGGLVNIKEGSQPGYILSNRNPANYGNIGQEAVDLSINSSSSTSKGATGYRSFAAGAGVTASGQNATAIGREAIASGYLAVALNDGKATGRNTFTAGEQANASARGSAVLGSNATVATGQNLTGHSLNDEVFKVGRGLSAAAKKDALTIYKNGALKIDPITAAEAVAITPTEGMEIFVSSIDATFTDIGRWSYSNGSWSYMEAAGGAGGISEAPIDGTQYARKDAAWEAVAATASTVGFSSMNYLEDYTSQEYTGATDIATVYGIHPPFNSQMSFKRYKGKFDRTYYIYQAYVPNREGKIFWYDHGTNEYSATYKLSDTASSQDTHHIYTINIIKDGRIQVISSYNDGVINVYTSTYPELDNNGAIDAAYTASVGAAAMTTYSNYVSSAYSNNKFILEWRGQANSNPTQEHRTLAVSEDNGQTFAANVEWLAFNNGMWAYGGMYPDHYRGGVFLTVARQNNSLGAYNGWGVLWTKDFITFGNMEYYATNGVSGISKNVVGTGAITQAEFEASYVVIDDGSAVNRQHYVPLLYQLGNGDIITHTCDGIRSGVNIISDYVTSHFSIETKVWVHKYAALATDFDVVMDSGDAPLVNVGLVPMDNLSMYMAAKAQDDAGYLFKTTDGGDTWTMVEQVVSLANAMATAPFAHADKSTSIIIHDYDIANTINELKILRFEEQLLSNTYSTQGDEFIDSGITTVAAGNYTVLTTDKLILKTAITVAGDTITLPSDAYSGQPFTIKDSSGNAGTDNITIGNAGTGTIDGSATVKIIVNYGAITVVFDGNNFHITNAV